MRKRNYYKKQVRKPDATYGRVDVGLFINYLMHGGKKSVAERVFYDALQEVKNQAGGEPLVVFEQAMQSASPHLETVSRRVGGANYQIPREVRPERKFFLAAKWIIEAARGQKGGPMAKRLAGELLNAAKGEGAAVKKKQNMHRMAEANRAFASFLR